MNKLDHIARHTRFSFIHPSEKACLLFFCFLITAFWRLPAAGCTVTCAALLYVLIARVPFFFYIKLLAVPVLFIGIGVLPIAFSYNGWLGISFSDSSIQQALLTASSALGGAAALYAFILTTPFSQIVWLMKRWRISPLFIDISVIVYRFIFQLSERKTAILHAQLLRAGRPGIQLAARTAVHTFTSTMLEMDKRHQAVELRGGLHYYATANWASFWRKTNDSSS